VSKSAHSLIVNDIGDADAIDADTFATANGPVKFTFVPLASAVLTTWDKLFVMQPESLPVRQSLDALEDEADTASDDVAKRIKFAEKNIVNKELVRACIQEKTRRL
jgi:hypothetical protein